VSAPLVLISFPTLPDGRLGEAYSYPLAYYGSCGRRFVSVTGLPPGLLADNTGFISGVPQSAGDFAVHADVCNNDILEPECTEGEFTLRIWPSNDACADAIPIREGLHHFGNTGATTDGPPEPACQYGGESQVGPDVWYEYTSSCDGEATVDLCDSGFDTKVAVYRGSRCRTLDGAVACNDDGCGLQSRLRWAVELGSTYLVRIGGYHGDQGNGRMLITCMNDCNGNLVSDAEEIAVGGDSDCNRNTRPDSCDVRGDYNADGSLNLLDWPAWSGCLWGPCGPGVCSLGIYAEPCCAWVDFAGDGDVDLQDFAVLQARGVK